MGRHRPRRHQRHRDRLRLQPRLRLRQGHHPGEGEWDVELHETFNAPKVTLGENAALVEALAGGAARSRAGGGQATYFCTIAPTCGSAATTCLAAWPRTVRYALMMVGRSEAAARASVTESRASDTSSPRLAR